MDITIEFDVKMTTAKLYDYLLYHTYTSFSGILGVFVGFCLLLLFYLNGSLLYLGGGFLVLGYLPVSLYLHAKRQLLLTPAFKEPLHYRLTEEGIEISQQEARDFQAWKDMRKVVATSKSIIIYTGKISASILPKTDLQEQYQGVVEMISRNMDPGKVKIRTL